MGRSSGYIVENSFTQGLKTEVTGLNFPEDAVTESDNCIFSKTGEVTRRLGLDIEVGSTYADLEAQGLVKTFNWESASQVGTNNFIVVSIGYYIYFYDKSEFPLSSGKKSFTIDLRNYKTSEAATEDILKLPASFSSGNGYLFIAHPKCEPTYTSYDLVTDTISTNSITIKIRDFQGLDDGLEVTERPTTLSLEHEYNLHNQGWHSAVGGSNPIEQWRAANLDNGSPNYPSNSDIYYLYKDANDTFVPSNSTNSVLPNTEAPQGHKILDAFSLRRELDHSLYNFNPPTGSTATNGTTTLVSLLTTSGNRPSQTEFYSSRVWWAGVNKEEFASNIYYSKIIETESDFGKCYQQNDPTSEFISDLLSSDGGVIKIPEVSEIVLIKAVGNFLVVFAKNGIWSISGTDLTSFIADSYKITKISEIGAISSLSFVSADGIPVWWNTSGIYTLSIDGSSEGAKVVSITNNTIKTFFENIPSESKYYVQGAFDLLEKTITWVYRSTQPGGLDYFDQFYYDSALVLNLDTSAFYPHSFPSTDVYIGGIINISGNFERLVEQVVTDGSGNTVTDGLGNDVTSPVLEQTFTDSVNKFFVHKVSATSGNRNFSWGDLTDIRYLDFYTEDSTGVDYLSYFISGYRLRGDGMRDFQNNYITIYSRVEDSSSFFISGKWDFSNNTNSLRDTTKQQGYSSKPFQEYSFRKLKIRGTGKSLQYRLESETGKPFNIIGWSVFDTVNNIG